MSDQEMLGNLKFFDRRRNYGFIRGTDGPDIFIHIKNFDRSVGRRALKPDTVIRYKLERRRNRQGPKAEMWKIDDTHFGAR